MNISPMEMLSDPRCVLLIAAAAEGGAFHTSHWNSLAGRFPLDKPPEPNRGKFQVRSSGRKLWRPREGRGGASASSPRPRSSASRSSRQKRHHSVPSLKLRFGNYLT